MATFSFRFGASGRRPMGLGGRIFLFLFSLMFFAVGLLFTKVFVDTTVETFATYSWAETPCRIVASAPETGRDEESPYAFWVEYAYERKDAPRTSHRHRLSDWSTSDYEDVQRLLDRYAPGMEATCYVDPADPDRAILERDGPWVALAVLFPLVFVAAGGAGMVFAVRGGWRKRGASDSAQAISAGGPKRLNPLFLALFFTPFLAVGLGTLYPLGVRPIAESADARHWRQTPCTVIQSAVRTHEGDDGNTYSVDILYEYEWEGRVRRSNRYSVTKVSSSGFEAKAAIVESLPPGARAVCWVNPEDPVVAVLKRDSAEGFLVLLFPGIFGLVGGLGVFFSLRAWWRSRSPASAEIRTSRRQALPGRGAKILRPVTSPLTKFALVLLFALFWNGITWIFACQALQGWLEGSPDYFLTIFISLFVLAGLLVASLAFSQFLALFNPRVRLEPGADTVRAGEPVGLSWSLSRGARKVTHLRITLEGREETVVSSGKNSRTLKETVYAETVVDTDPSTGAAFGGATLSIPAGAMHTFTEPRHKIVWALKVQGEIPAWPDLDEEFALEVEAGG